MKISSFSVIVSFIALAIVGCALIPRLPVMLLPSKTLPSITVSFSMPYNSARVVENEVTSRIESTLARVKGVTGIDSKSYNGGSYVTINLDRHADMGNTRLEVSSLVRQIWANLPNGVSYPTISLQQAQEQGGRPFLTLTLNAPANPFEIQTFAEKNLKPILAQIPGVNNVELRGGQPMEWRLEYDIDQLTSLGITPGDIRKAIQEHYDSEFLGIASINTVNANTGNTNTANNANGEQRMRLSMHSMGTNNAFIPQEITLRTPTGELVTLDKIVSVSHEEARPTGYFRINGLNSIYVNITSEESANQLKVANQIKSALASFERTMPQGSMIEITYDATDRLSNELDKIYFRTCLTVLILLLFVWVVSLNFRYVLLITIGLAINLAVAVVFYYLTSLEINLYTLAGITISFNLVIDNLIVMADHYTRCHNLRVFTAIVSATLTTVAALSVVFLMDERTRALLHDFVIVIIINLAVSLAVTLWLVPALVDKLGLHRGMYDNKLTSLTHLRRRLSLSLSNKYQTCVGFILRYRIIFILLTIIGFGLPTFLIPNKIEGDSAFAKKYNEVFGSAIYKEKIKPVTDAVLGGTLRLFVEKVYNGTYWSRESTEPVLSINATLPNGATLEQMNALIKKMEKFLSGFPEIRQFHTSIMSPRRASISVMFNQEHQYDGFPYRLKGEAVAKALTLGGGSWSITGLEDQGFNNGMAENTGSYRVKLTGYNYDDLSGWTYRLRDTLLTHPRIQDVTVGSEVSYWKDDYTEFHLAIDRDLLAKHDLNAKELFAAIEPPFGRDISCGYTINGNQMENIKLYSKQADQYDLYSLMNQPFSIGGRNFKLSDIAQIQKHEASQDIVKKNQEYVMYLQFEYIGSDIQGEKVLDRDLEQINSLMPMGYQAISERHQSKSKDDSSKYLLLLVVLIIIFFTTSIQFNSLRQPFAVILIIPVSFIGVFSVFYLFKLNFDQGGFTSFILLAGMTVNAAIYLIDEYNSQRHSYPNMSPLRLYIRAFRVKIVPIILTVLSTVLGIIPFLVADKKETFFYTFSWGTIAGLAMSLFALVVILPIILLPRTKKLLADATRSYNV